MRLIHFVPKAKGVWGVFTRAGEVAKVIVEHRRATIETTKRLDARDRAAVDHFIQARSKR